MNVFDPAFSQDFFSAFDAPCNFVRCFDERGFDINDSKTNSDFGINFAEKRDLAGIAPRHFQHDMIGVQAV